MQQRAIRPKNMPVTMFASAGVLMIVAGLVTMAVVAIADRLDASALDPAFCSPSSLHTTTEPPETQLTRDYGAIRILLKDPADHVSQIRRVYAGDLHVSVAAPAQTVILKRADRAKLFKAEYQRFLDRQLAAGGPTDRPRARDDSGADHRPRTAGVRSHKNRGSLPRNVCDTAGRLVKFDSAAARPIRHCGACTSACAAILCRRPRCTSKHQRARTGCTRKLCP